MSYLQGPFTKKPSLRAVISLLGLWLALLSPMIIFGQDDLNVHGVVSNAVTSSKISDVKVIVKKNGTEHNSFTTRANGKYEFYLSCDAKYEIVFQKQGFAKRSLIIDATNVPAEFIGAGVLMAVDMSMYEITEAMKDQDLSVFDPPIGKSKYNPEQNEMVFDFDYTAKIKAAITTFMRDIEKRQKELDKEASAADKAAADNEAKFTKFMKDGEAAMGKQNFQDAVLNFKAALEIKPTDLIVKGKLGDAETKYNAQQATAKLSADYAAALDAGDGFIRTEEFQKAIDSYNAALALKPGEKYPTDQIALATKTMAERAANMQKQEQFNVLMAAGEKLFKDKEYEGSLAKYQEAKKVFPDDKEVARKITEVTDAIANKDAIAAKQAKYDGLVASADQKFSAKDYQAALTDYKAAGALLPDETYPPKRIAEAEAKIAALANAAEQQKSFDTLLADGDKAMTATDYQTAIDKYTEALGIFSDDASAKAKLKDAQSIFAEKQAAAKNREKYDALISEADGLLKGEELSPAKSKYEEARKLIPEETYPLDQITKIDVRLKALAASAEAQANYDAAMAAGTAAVDGKKYTDAIAQFETALGIIPKDKVATTALENAKVLKKEFDANQQTESAYADKLASADKKMANDAFAEARTEYLAAQGLKPGESYPKTQIELIDATLAQRKADAAKAAEQDAIEAEYQKFINAGDAAHGKSDFAEAISRFEDALGVKAGDVIAQSKLDEAKAAQKAKLQASEINDQYTEWIKRGDEKLGASALDDALAAYSEASQLKAAEVYPKNQIKLIEERIAKEAKASADADAQARAEQVNALILQGDNLVKESAFENGIVKYNEALALAPKRTDIQPKIDAAMSKMLAYQEAAGLDEAYEAAIKEADKDFGKSNWQRAKASYESALKIKSGETYPKDQLAQIETKLAAEAAAADAERQKQIQSEFDSFIADGDKSFKKQKYEDALRQYEDALALIPSSEIALAKIGEVNELLGALDKELADQRKYDKLVGEGDALFAEADYEMARLKFLDAKDLKPGEKYPEKKIQEIDIQLEKLRLAATADEADALNQQYRDAIKSGDALMIENNYESAITAFEGALVLKPGEIYPQGQIERANLMIKENAENEARKKRLAERKKTVEEKPKRANENLSRVNSNSEEQAEQFMRDAREAQEKEKYERIKKLKDQQTSNVENRENESKALRDAEYSRIAELQSQDQFAEARALSDEKAKTSVQYKQALIDSRQIRAETHDVLTKEAFDNIQKDATKRNEWMTNRESIHEEHTAKFTKQKENQLKQIQEWTYASAEERLKMSEKIQEQASLRVSENQKAEESRKESIVQIKERETEINEQRASLVSNNLEDIKAYAAKNRDAQQTTAARQLEKNDRKVNDGARQIQQEKARQSTALDDAASQANIRRAEAAEDLTNLQSNEPKAYNDYFRSQLAENYPAGVSEESATLGNKVIITRIVVKGNRGDEYKKVLDKAGNYYFKNGQSISENTWNRETIQAFNKKD